MQNNALVSNRELCTLNSIPKQANQHLFTCKLLIKSSIDLIVLNYGSVQSFVTSVGQEKLMSGV